MINVDVLRGELPAVTAEAEPKDAVDITLQTAVGEYHAKHLYVYVNGICVLSISNIKQVSTIQVR